MNYVPGTEIAKLVRKEIKDAIKAGRIVLPEGAKISVVSSYNNVSVGIKGVTAEWLYTWGKNSYGYEEWLWSKEAQELHAAVEAIRSSRKLDTTVSPETADYYTSNYYGHTSFPGVYAPRS